MENREEQILSELKSMAAALRCQLEMLEDKLFELEQAVACKEEPEEIDIEEEPIDIELDFAEPVVPEKNPVEEVEIIPVREEDLTATSEDIPDDDLPESEVIPEDDDLPAADYEKVPEAVSSPILNDVLAPDCAWRIDMPGTAVRDIRSAISLNDRVIFINLLFNENAQAFVDALARINTMTSLNEVVEYINTEHPSWDLNSDLVYRFMMAVRRKVK